jgi:hypothetical protein
LFGIHRTTSEAYRDQNFNPYLDATDPNTWDEIQSQDASYRSRLIKFSRAIPLGATYIGLKTMVEALVGASCEIYESWALVDEQLGSISGSSSVLSYSYSLLEKTAIKWGGLEGVTWGTWGGGSITQVSRLGFNTRSDFVIQPKRELTQPEQYQLVRTIERFRPAGTSFLVDPQGVALHRDIMPRKVTADSEYWEVTSLVTPNTNLTLPPGGIYPANPKQARPAFSQYQSEEWSYNGDITEISSYVMDSGNTLTRGDDELVTYSDGTQRRYAVADASMTPAEALSAKLVSDGILTSGAYAPARGLSVQPVVTA